MTLPTFRYHPDPVGSGSIIQSENICLCCGAARGWIYTGPVYAELDLDDAICPWCIADGSANKKFGATFVADCSLDEICERTPGFSAWQSESWLECCGEPASFITPAGITELRKLDRSLEGVALNHVIYEMNISGRAAIRMVESLNKDKGPTAYVFRCLRCAQYLLNVDSH